MTEAARMAQVGLGRHIHQRLAERPGQLPTQGMEEVGRRRDIGYHHIQLGAHLQKALQPGAGMVRPAGFIAMWQQQYQSVHDTPLLFGAADVLIDDYLSSISKIAVLGLPDGEHMRVGHGIAIFITQHRQLA